MKGIWTVAILVGLLLAGCRSTATPSGSGQATPTGPSITPSATADAGPDTWTGDDGPQGILAAIITNHYADHDQVVFRFHGRQAPNAIVSYTGEVTMDPSDKPVPLAGRAFVVITFQHAGLSSASYESDPARVVSYSGPTRLTLRYPLLQELALAGDFEAVLHFGIGLSAVAGLSAVGVSTVDGISESTPPNSASVSLDFWRTAPPRLLWPVTTVAQAQQFQANMPSWAFRAQGMATTYVEQVLAWPGVTPRPISPTVFEAEFLNWTAVLTLIQPLNQPQSMWAIASVLESRRSNI
jgi:hypothetical protein